jgi:putative glutamine amidotransferase
MARTAGRGWRPFFVEAGDVGTSSLLRLTDRADAVIVMGGEDVDPSFYGGPRDYPGASFFSPAADEAQIALVLRAAERHTPVFGICRGIQLVNVAFGGDLIQHLATGLDHLHGIPPRTMAVHDVRLDPACRFAPLGEEGTDLIRGVCSSHHQAAGRLGEGLTAAAWAEDGTIEAVEHVDAPLIAVQWHPECPEAPAHHLDSTLDVLGSLVAPMRYPGSDPG